ncbi:MAG: LamG-like jellyroll fold domain-containing protein [Acidithiobacillus sp.]|uniref:OmpL47-type beta-barrel domain-containing protein n=1 Tax=Acidithiobacillus sp. TaxID=1872118 RepID=UPI00355E5940
MSTDEESVTYYKWNDATEYLIYEDAITPPGEGTHTLHYYSIDTYGNVEYQVSEIINIDINPPTTSTSFNGTTLLLNANDNVSGVYSTYYTRDGSDPTVNSSPGNSIVVNTREIVKFFSIDNIGNLESIKYWTNLEYNKSTVISLTSQPFVLENLMTLDVEVTAGIDNIIFNDVDFTNINNISVDEIVLAINSQAIYINAKATIDNKILIESLAEDSGNNIIILNTSTAADNLGFTSNNRVAHTIIPDELKIPDGNNKWYISPATIALLYNSDIGNSNDDRILYVFDDDITQKYIKYEYPIYLNKSGKIKLHYYSYNSDIDEKFQLLFSRYYKIDLEKPITRDDISDLWSNIGVVVNLIAFDEHSGIYKTYYTIDGTDPTILSNSGNRIEINNEGQYTIKYFSIDNAGNIEDTVTSLYNVKIDKIPPITSISEDVIPIGGIYTTNPVITLTAIDTLSGIRAIYYKWEDEVEYKKYEIQFKPKGNGTHVLSYYSVDNAGNIENRHTKTYIIDEETTISGDIIAPYIGKYYPNKYSSDSSLSTDIVLQFIDDESGIDISSINISINNESYFLLADGVLKIKYIGTASSCIMNIKNNSLYTIVNNIVDVSFSFYDTRFNTIFKILQYFDSLNDYECNSISSLDGLLNESSTTLLNVVNLDIKSKQELLTAQQIKNKNFKFRELSNGYEITITPKYTFEDGKNVVVNVYVKDFAKNELSETYSFSCKSSSTESRDEKAIRYSYKNEFLKRIYTNMPSNYNKYSNSTTFSFFLDAFANELSKMERHNEFVFNDMYWDNTRAEYLYKNIGYIYEIILRTGVSHNDYRTFLRAFENVFQIGSLKTNIEDALALFFSVRAEIKEHYLNDIYDIDHQFIFDVNIIFDKQKFSEYDMSLVDQDIQWAINQIKPAHTEGIIKYIFSDNIYLNAGCKKVYDYDTLGNIQYYPFPNFENYPNIQRVVKYVLNDFGFLSGTKSYPTALCDRSYLEFDIMREETYASSSVDDALIRILIDGFEETINNPVITDSSIIIRTDNEDLPEYPSLDVGRINSSTYYGYLRKVKLYSSEYNRPNSGQNKDSITFNKAKIVDATSYINIASSGNINTNLSTLEFCIIPNFNSHPATDQYYFDWYNGINDNNRISIYYTISDKKLHFIIYDQNGDSIDLYQDEWAPLINQTYFVELIWDDTGSCYAFINGKFVTYYTDQLLDIRNSNTGDLVFGTDNSHTTFFDGSITEVRISSNIRHTIEYYRYGYRFVSDANTLLLWHCVNSTINSGGTATVNNITYDTITYAYFYYPYNYNVQWLDEEHCYGLLDVWTGSFIAPGTYFNIDNTLSQYNNVTSAYNTGTVYKTYDPSIRRNIVTGPFIVN